MDEPMAESPEARFIFGYILQAMLDINRLGKRKLNRNRRKRPWSEWEEAYAAEMEWIASPTFHWYVTLMGLDPLEVASHIIKVANGEIQHTNLYVGFKTTNAAKNREAPGKKTGRRTKRDSQDRPERGGSSTGADALCEREGDSDLQGPPGAHGDADAGGQWWDDGYEIE